MRETQRPVQADFAGVPTRILIADPDEHFARQLELALVVESAVDVVGWAGDAEETVKLAQQYSADVVLLAADLPDAAGALEQLAKLVPKPKAILMSDDTSPGSLFGSVAEVSGFVQKGGEVSGFVRKTAETTEMVTLVVALVALANVRSGELNGLAH